MKRDPLFYVLSGIAAALLFWLWSVLASAQDVTPVTKGIDPAGIILVLAGVALVGGMILLKRKRPDLYGKVTRTGSTMLHDAEHTIGAAVPKVFESAKNAVQGVSEQVHGFAAHVAPPVAPAVALPPSAYVPVPVPATLVAVPGVPPLTTEQFMSDEPLPVASAPAAGPRIVNGRVVL